MRRGTVLELRLEAPRLILRQWQSADVLPFAGMCADTKVMQWIGTGQTLSDEESASAVTKFRLFWAQRAFGLFAIELKGSRSFPAFCGLSIPSFLPEILPAVEIGWRLDRYSRGKGCATEAAIASMLFDFNEAGLDEILSIHQIGNTASERIMERLGMLFERTTVDRTCMRPVNVRRISCAEWISSLSPGPA